MKWINVTTFDNYDYDSLWVYVECVITEED